MYTVKEVADLCEVNYDTVTRWIRGGVLVSNKNSKKEGYAISNSEFERFLALHPKYRIKVGEKIDIGDLNYGAVKSIKLCIEEIDAAIYELNKEIDKLIRIKEKLKEEL